MPSKDIRLQILQDPMNSALRRTRWLQGAQKEHGSGNDYTLLAATRQNTLYSTTLFSSKEGCSASKIGVSGTARQHGSGEARRDQSTQVQCDAGLGVDPHRTIVRWSGMIYPELLDEGTRPTSQDFFHLPARTA
jgi:hypothetical protein